MTSPTTPTVETIVREFGADRSRLLDIAESVQNRFGYISNDAVQAIATGLGIHTVEVDDMISFYSFLDRRPRGRFHIRLSRTPIAIMKGANHVEHAFEQALGISIGETSPDGLFTLAWTSDIGMSDQEPAALVNRMVLTELTPADVPAIVAALRQDGEGATLSSASIRPSLVQAGPLLSGPRDPGAGIVAALARSPDEVIEEIAKSRLRGRGGAGFPTAMKWRLTRRAAGQEH